MATREEQKNETRKKILASAIHLISKKGVNGTSIKDIAASAEVAVGTFYLYFNSKEDVIKCLDRTEHKELLEKIKAMKNLSCVQKIYEYFSKWYEIGGEYEPGFIREWHCLNLSCAKDNETSGLPGGELEHVHVRELLQEAVDAGELNKKIPIEDIARLLVCGLWGSSVYLCVAPGRVSREKIAGDFIKYLVKPSLNPYLIR
ncbi:MAG: TetR/AcrR family transcriptional regulator [Synergistaceae bacterium]|nr:TetR/AcrR family transcriptional regulator [Synergistaceae bacterium]